MLKSLFFLFHYFVNYKPFNILKLFYLAIISISLSEEQTKALLKIKISLASMIKFKDKKICLYRKLAIILLLILTHLELRNLIADTEESDRVLELFKFNPNLMTLTNHTNGNTLFGLAAMFSKTNLSIYDGNRGA